MSTALHSTEPFGTFPGSLPGILVTDRSSDEIIEEMRSRGMRLIGITRLPGADDIMCFGGQRHGLNHYLDGDVTELQPLTTEAEG